MATLAPPPEVLEMTVVPTGTLTVRGGGALLAALLAVDGFAFGPSLAR